MSSVDSIVCRSSAEDPGSGSVFAPGPNRTTGVRIDVISALAGGRNRFAQPVDEVRVITPGGQTKLYSEDVRVEPGSSLVVPERNFSRSSCVRSASPSRVLS